MQCRFFSPLWWNITQKVSFSSLFFNPKTSFYTRICEKNWISGRFLRNIENGILCLQKEWQMNTHFIQTCCVLRLSFFPFWPIYTFNFACKLDFCLFVVCMAKMKEKKNNNKELASNQHLFEQDIEQESSMKKECS